MTKRSILLRPWEAAAFAEVRATAILRVMKPQPKLYPARTVNGIQPLQLPTLRWEPVWGTALARVDSDIWNTECPIGAPGDLLLCKETFCIESNRLSDERRDYLPPHDDGRPIRREGNPDDGDWWEQAHYRATDPEPELWYDDHDGPHCRWRSSTQMPEWAVRTRRVIERVRVVRRGDLRGADVHALGGDFHLVSTENDWRWLIETRAP
jgi:hypothetical protein